MPQSILFLLVCSKQVSFRNKVLVAFDWMKTELFGRDITRN
jgi:hypothetical protein